MDESSGNGEKTLIYRDPAPFHCEAQGLQLGFYPAGPDRLDRLLQLIGEARGSLKLAFYIFARDDSGRVVRDALADAARRGVEVTVIVDGFGAEADGDFFAPLMEAGGKFYLFLAKWSRRYLIRNHQKIVVADGETAMLGGFNIEDSYFEPPERNGWNDLAITVSGPVVERIEEWFDRLEAWADDAHSQFRAIRRSVRDWNGGNGPVQLLIGGPTKGLSSWAHIISRDLMYGTRLDVMMAYFSPSRRLRSRIRQIARKGQTRLVMAGKTDNGATIGASRLLYGNLLKAGARIWEFQPCRLHTKLIVLDDAVYLGSANFDMRSLYLNLEIVLRVEDRHLADTMRGFIAQHLPASQEITREVHRQNATWFNRLRWTISWFLVSVLDYSVSRKLNLGL
ncbi:phospholipase D-like domain-containing protein [Alteraurantiacibacter aquimixticola]|uniref:Phospholipase D n=1 Tax=Alteraurantiacibacter aquimixticola TaxID=2489173 RepID=A0A4T3F1E7_9SPHN|nr:phosphatidylserine/phosphatidylglycerophosphate/cardiolipin synthase family protein [Alteraurantiacibacter aquimixticola]TIX51015.1 phosphatidylserine/phosphatidylglycerophosphate/cardiolipin synthase family protein [Alteraurantiacibacter aquimixticola]